MGRGSSIAFAAAFRSVGVDAEICPESDQRTLELGGRHTSGEECLPAKITLGNFLKVTEQPGFVPERTAFFMTTADGPCRFGQYAPYITGVLKSLALDQVTVFSPSSRDGYGGIGVHARELMRTALRGLVCADVLRAMVHRTRPYEVTRGDTDRVHDDAIADVARVLERPGVPHKIRMQQLEASLAGAGRQFRQIATRQADDRVLIGVLGEIYCRLTPFANNTLIRKIEDLGGECVLAPLVEWVRYTNEEHQKRLRRKGLRFSKAMLGAKISDFVQGRDEHRLYRVFREELRGYEEPSIREVLEASQPYLPHTGALGEMTLSVGKAVCYYRQGCDGVVDVSPFTCMNGIVTEAVYPRVSADHDDIPIRNTYFDGVRANLDRDLDVFMELARSYRGRKITRRGSTARRSGLSPAAA
jgi:predicted nucleotide-binding protein (sugar kinase/HSP70/actin superfamily)